MFLNLEGFKAINDELGHACGDVGLFELRPRECSSTGRALYCFIQDRRIVIVHAFVKKTRTTPRRDLVVARQRIKELERG